MPRRLVGRKEVAVAHAMKLVTPAFSSLLAMGCLALAHVPLPAGEYTDPGRALFVPEPDISQVIYYELTPERRELWLAFSGEQPLWVDLGVPVIPDLADFEPLLALVGPGLPPPEADPPFAVPGELGVMILSPDPDIERGEFFERFTGTPSWDLGSWDLQLPEQGRYYLVATAAEERYGKLWVAVGRREVFTLADIMNLPQIMRDVRAFHRVEPSLPPWFRLTAQVGVLGVFVLVLALLR